MAFQVDKEEGLALRKSYLDKSRRVVVKVGSAVLTGEEGLDLADTYDSSHLGQEGMDGLSVIETRGRVAMGIHGLWNPGQISSLGLITENLVRFDVAAEHEP